MKVLGCIGAGSFGKVFKVSIQDQVFAIKKISLQFDCQDDGWELQQVQKQAKILEQCLYHPNIVRYYYSCKQADCYLIAMEYISGRPMSDLQMPFTNQNAIVAFIIQVLLALRHLKKNQILHRDLKPSNIIVSQKGLFKLVDFGISKKLDKSNYAASCLGTPYYTAPQILWEEKYDYKVDIWSFGVILYEICHGKLPFIANSMDQLKKRIRQNHPTVRQDINDDIKLIIRGCLTKNPANRFTIQQILNLPLIRQQIINQTFGPVHIPSLQ